MKSLSKILSSSCILAGIYFFKMNNEKARTMREICSKLIPKTPGDVSVSFDDVSDVNDHYYFLKK